MILTYICFLVHVIVSGHLSFSNISWTQSDDCVKNVKFFFHLEATEQLYSNNINEICYRHRYLAIRNQHIETFRFLFIFISCNFIINNAILIESWQYSLEVEASRQA